jgi:hypothetical protein
VYCGSEVGGGAACWGPVALRFFGEDGSEIYISKLHGKSTTLLTWGCRGLVGAGSAGLRRWRLPVVKVNRG